MNSNPVISRPGSRLLRYFSAFLIPNLVSGLETHPVIAKDKVLKQSQIDSFKGIHK